MSTSQPELPNAKEERKVPIELNVVQGSSGVSSANTAGSTSTNTSAIKDKGVK